MAATKIQGEKGFAPCMEVQGISKKETLKIVDGRGCEILGTKEGLASCPGWLTYTHYVAKRPTKPSRHEGVASPDEVEALRKEIRTLSRQREEDRYEYAKNLTAQAEDIRHLQRVAALEERLGSEVQVRDQRLEGLKGENAA